MTLTGEKAVPVLYLDIDGTVRHGRDELGRFVNGSNDVVIFPEAVEDPDGITWVGVMTMRGITSSSSRTSAPAGAWSTPISTVSPPWSCLTTCPAVPKR